MPALTERTTERLPRTNHNSPHAGNGAARAAFSGPFFWLTAFYFVYCARPEDWIPGLRYIPMAKITAIAALIGLLSSAGKTERSIRNLPREAWYLLALMGWLCLSAVFSPVWQGGALFHTIDFAKVFVAWVLTYLLVTSFQKLRRIIFVQSASVAIITLVSILKGYHMPRLEGVIGGIYNNPNDLAFAIVLSIPFCLAFLISAKNVLHKIGWLAAMLVMGTALLLTASRAGMIDMACAGIVVLWHMGVKGRRFHLIVGTAALGVLLLLVAGGRVKDRFAAISGDELNTEVEGKAYSSYEARIYLMQKSLDGIAHYPIFGLGVNNFTSYSGIWHEVHMTYLEIAVEGGVPAFVLFMLFFYRGFRNLARLRKNKKLTTDERLFVGALHSSLIGFAVGACFAPEAYQFFPYFAVAYTSVLLALVAERGDMPTSKRPALSSGFYRNDYVRDREKKPVITVG